MRIKILSKRNLTGKRRAVLRTINTFIENIDKSEEKKMVKKRPLAKILDMIG